MLITGQEKRSWPEWRSQGGKGIARVGLALLFIGAAALCPTGVAAASAAPRPAGLALAWGSNYVGQLGDGSTTDRFLPVPVHLPAGVRVTAVAAGGYHGLALMCDGRVLAWGGNDEGQLGNGTTVSSILPVPVHLPAGTRVTAIAAGFDDSLALTSDGRMLAWGNDGAGELGDGFSGFGRYSPVPVWVPLPPGTHVTAIAADVIFSLAVTCDGRVLAWGRNDAGQLGDGDVGLTSTAPVWVHLPPGTHVTAVAAGDYHGLALTAHGHVLAWGDNSVGDLGDGTTTDSSVPIWVHLPRHTRVTAIAAGDDSLALAGQSADWT